MVLAERIKGDWSLDHLADLAVGAAPALRRKGRHQLGVALIAFGRVEQRVEKASRTFGGARGVERHTEGPKDLGGITLESLPVGIADLPRPDPLPVAVLDVLVTQGADSRIEFALGHQFSCKLSSD